MTLELHHRPKVAVGRDAAARQRFALQPCSSAAVSNDRHGKAGRLSAIGQRFGVGE